MKVRYKKLSEGEKEFTVKKQITIPMISITNENVDQKRTFLEGGKVVGEHVVAQIIKQGKKGSIPYGEIESVMIRDEQGVYLIPIGEVTWNAPTWDETGYNDQQKTAIDKIYGSEKSSFNTEEVETAYNSVKDKTFLGFTVQQLLVITGLMIIVSKISK